MGMILGFHYRRFTFLIKIIFRWTFSRVLHIRRRFPTVFFLRIIHHYQTFVVFCTCVLAMFLCMGWNDFVGIDSSTCEVNMFNPLYIMLRNYIKWTKEELVWNNSADIPRNKIFFDRESSTSQGRGIRPQMIHFWILALINFFQCEIVNIHKIFWGSYLS
jgi:hypothetical protein